MPRRTNVPDYVAISSMTIDLTKVSYVLRLTHGEIDVCFDSGSCETLRGPDARTVSDAWLAYLEHRHDPK